MNLLRTAIWTLLLLVLLSLHFDVTQGYRKKGHGTGSHGAKSHVRKASVAAQLETTRKQIAAAQKAMVKAEKSKITPKNAVKHTGIGGAYGKLDRHAKKGLVERDHVIPSSVYKSAKDGTVRKIDKDSMPAITLPYGVHRKLATTGSHKKNPLVDKVKNQFAKGQYEAAMSTVIDMYKKNPSRSGEKQGNFYNLRSKAKGQNSPGARPGDMNAAFRQVLSQSVKIGLLKGDERKRLIQKHHLNDKQR